MSLTTGISSDHAAPAASPRPPSLGVFRHRDFRLFELSRLLMITGVQMVSVALGWQVYGISGDPLDLGYIGLSQFVPAVVLALVAGHVADRFDRRRIVLACVAATIGCAGILAWQDRRGAPSLAVIYLVSVGIGAIRAFSAPASQSLLPHLVPAGEFGRAVGIHLVAFQLGSVLGPAAGGAVYVWGRGAGAVYEAAAGLFAAALLAVAAMRVRLGAREASGMSWPALLAGVRYVRGHRTLLGAMSLDLFAVLLGGAVALLPVYARDILHTGPRGLGVLRSAPAVGAGIAALWLTWRPIERRAGRWLLACVTIFGLATVAFGLSRHFALSVAALAVQGAADMVSVAVRQTLIQVSTPDAVRGRVTAVALVFIGASNELGEFESGLTAAWFGVVPAVVVGGAGTCLVVAVWAWLFPELRRIDRIEAAGFGHAGGST